MAERHGGWAWGGRISPAGAAMHRYIGERSRLRRQRSPERVARPEQLTRAIRDATPSALHVVFLRMPADAIHTVSLLVTKPVTSAGSQQRPCQRGERMWHRRCMHLA
jgi:hypothetical protein